MPDYSIIPDFLKRDPNERPAMPESKPKGPQNGAIQGPSVATDASNHEGATLQPPAQKAISKPRKGSVQLDQFGFRIGSLKSKAAEMYSTGEGATSKEVRDRLKSHQFNLLDELRQRGFEITKTLVSEGGRRKVGRFKIVVKGN